MADTSPATAKDTPASEGRLVHGIVTSDTMNKTRRVEVQRLVQHAKYGKFIKKRTVCYTHDEANESRLGDTVEIQESRPLSKTKRWTLIRILTKAPSRTVANLEGAVAGSQLPTEPTASK
jgi:small subunit ribosomal protein S17